ncbi:MAG: M23 family metallopeptidase [Bacteroidota bacterium]
MIARFTILATFLFGIGLSPTSAQESLDFDPSKVHYTWPTEASNYLSSTFGETRSAHFHAALDIKTWGRRGYEVYATRDGIVDRIAIGPRGYGKVIYLKHADGSYSVYAHLLSFNDQLQELADSIRFKEGHKFELERFLGNRNIPVKQGEVIGYSGASGIGPPHLHFELRTPSHKPFNPLLTNLSVTDDIAPQIQGISIEPLSPSSSIEGKNAIYTKRAQLDNGDYDLGSIQVSGPVGLGVDAFDQSNRVHNTYAVYQLNLSVNGQQLFSSQVDSFSYHNSDQMFIDRVYPILQESNKGYQRLYLADGNTLSFYNTSRQKGILNLPPGSHQVTIEANDYFGNSTTARLTLEVEDNQQDRKPMVYHQKNTEGTKNIDSPHLWNWFANWVTLSGEQFINTTLAMGEEDLHFHENGVAVDLRSRNRMFIHTPATGALNFYRINPEQRTFISSSDLKGFVRFPKSTFYDTVSVGMSVNEYTSDSVSVEIIPDAFPIKETYTLFVKRDSTLSDTAKRSFYHWDRDDEEWELVPTTFDSDYISSKAESLGTFMLMKDNVPPEVKNPRLKERPDGKWIVLIDATDNLSGIDYNSTEISVDGTKGIAEFEPEDDRFVYYHPRFEPSEEQMEITISTRDKMGNKTERTFTLEQLDAKK